MFRSDNLYTEINYMVTNLSAPLLQKAIVRSDFIISEYKSLTLFSSLIGMCRIHRASNK